MTAAKSEVGPYDPEGATELAVLLHRHLAHPDTDDMRRIHTGRWPEPHYWGGPDDEWGVVRGKVRLDRKLIRAFQEAAGIADDGAYGPTTAGALSYWFRVSGKDWGKRRRVAFSHGGDVTKVKRLETLYEPPDRLERLGYDVDRERHRHAGLTLHQVLKHSEPVPPKPVSFEREVSPYFDPGFEDWPGVLCEGTKILPDCTCFDFCSGLCDLETIAFEQSRSQWHWGRPRLSGSP